MNDRKTKVIIIGAGPAGIACAIQLKRYNIDSTIFEKNKIGGLLQNAHLVENYLGFPNGISGEKLVQLLNKQSLTTKLNIKHEIVESVTYYKNTISVKANEKIYNTRYLVIASGTKPIVPKTPIIQDEIKDKVFFDIYKLRQTKNKYIAIIGAGDCAFDNALNLSKNNKVLILNRGDRINALPILHDRVSKIKNIKYFDNIDVKQVDLKSSGISLLCNPNNVIISADYLLIAIGREPNYEFISKDLLISPDIFQIGDVKNGQFRQASIAAGDGTFTAMMINNRLNNGN